MFDKVRLKQETEEAEMGSGGSSLAKLGYKREENEGQSEMNWVWGATQMPEERASMRKKS